MRFLAAASPQKTNSPSFPSRLRLHRESTKQMDAISSSVRTCSVYSTALGVFWRIKRTQWKERGLKKRLGLSLDDDDLSHPELDVLWEQTHEHNAEAISQSIVHLKGLWIKVGQFLSSRPDIMPLPYIHHFRKLQDALPSRSWNEVDEMLRRSLGSTFRSTFFSEIDETPMSSASIAQVHRARLQSGEEVVIKARHKDVEKLMQNDLANLETLCNWIAWVNEDYDFRKIVKEWIPAVQEELDLRNEARNLQEIRENMERAGIRVIVPRIPNKDLVKPDVLVMEYCQGFSVREVDTYEKHRVDRLALLDRICASWAVQMHINGHFNADPHPGNILISTNPDQNGGDPSVPVLLDFGLARRFDDKIKLAFSRLVHSCYTMDVDGLLRSFEEMGLKVREQDPFQDVVNLRSAFQTVPASEAKAEKEKRLKEYRTKQKNHPKPKRPVDAWPGELVFFTRVIGLLKGLCSTMEVRYPYLKTTAAVALETLKQAVDQRQHASGLIYPDTLAQNASFQQHICKVVEEAKDREAFLGMQVAAMHKGVFLADVTAGTLGTADPRPVKPDTLFNVFSVTKGIAAALLHMAIQKTGASYDDLVSKYWPGFEQNGKEQCTLRHVLNHRAGLAGALPDMATLDEILDWTQMLSFLQKSPPTHAPGEKEEYHYLTFGYLVGGILQGMTGKNIDTLLDEWIIQPLDLGDELHIGLPSNITDDRLAVLHVESMVSSQDGMLTAFGSENPAPRTDVPKWERFKGSEYLYNPTTFNMRQVREACIPSANGHMSARALARFYSALSPRAPSPLMDIQPLYRELQQQSTKTEDAYKDYAAFAERAYSLGFRVFVFRREENGELVYGMGHPGLGGSFGLVIPEEDFALGITQSHLVSDRINVKAVLHHVCTLLNLTMD